MIPSKDAVIVHQEDMGADANSRVQMASMDGTAPNPAPVRTVHIVMGQMDGACAQQDSREINVSRSAPKECLDQLVAKIAIVESTNAIQRMESVYALLEDMVHYVRRSVEQEDMESLV